MRRAARSLSGTRIRAGGELRARPGVPSPIATLPRCHVLPGPGDGVPRIPGCGTSPKPGAAAQISIATWRGALCPAPPSLPPQGHLNATSMPPWPRPRPGTAPEGWDLLDAGQLRECRGSLPAQRAQPEPGANPQSVFVLPSLLTSCFPHKNPLFFPPFLGAEREQQRSGFAPGAGAGQSAQTPSDSREKRHH